MGTLHVVATPIGNLEDVTLRALRVLREADLVLAEDTRRTRILLDRHGIAARPRSLHAHNEAARTADALAALRAGRVVALVSDAGTPLVSDPGARLVAAAVAEGHDVVSVPGASAVLAALAVSGLAGDGFAFLGFLPRRDGERRALLRAHRGLAGPLVLFESPRRVAATLRLLREELGDRAACVARELTKLHEEVARAPLSALAARYADGARGELTIVVAGAAPGDAAASDEAPASDEGALDARIRELLAAGRSPREIASALARPGLLPRRVVYARAVAVREGA
jgi:16S rRNA (cytidine1402-2'-O)-methyltransferase